jgi:hypothetical protein
MIIYNNKKKHKSLSEREKKFKDYREWRDNAYGGDDDYPRSCELSRILKRQFDRNTWLTENKSYDQFGPASGCHINSLHEHKLMFILRTNPEFEKDFRFVFFPTCMKGIYHKDYIYPNSTFFVRPSRNKIVANQKIISFVIQWERGNPLV